MESDEKEYNRRIDRFGRQKTSSFERIGQLAKFGQIETESH